MSEENKEEILRSFIAHRLILLREHEAIKSCTIFLTNSRVIVATIEGINLWIVAIVMVALAASFAGLILRNFELFLGGLGVGIVAAIVIGLVDYLVRLRRRGMMKKLSPDRIVERGKENFEIRYSTVSKVEVRTSQTYSRGSWFLPLSFPEHRYVLDFFTDSNKHTFVLEPSDLNPCLNLIRKYAPEIIEIEED